MIIKKITAAKGAGRRQVATFDNVVGFLFMMFIFMVSVTEGYTVFGYFGMGLLITRIGGIIFEVSRNLFDRPFFHYLLLVGIPAQYLVKAYLLN